VRAWEIRHELHSFFPRRWSLLGVEFGNAERGRKIWHDEILGKGENE
jgi:hypothetical protein